MKVACERCDVVARLEGAHFAFGHLPRTPPGWAVVYGTVALEPVLYCQRCAQALGLQRAPTEPPDASDVWDEKTECGLGDTTEVDQ